MEDDDVNLILFTDSYKISHHKQYPEKLTYLKAYFESRGGKYKDCVFFGLQYILRRWLSRRVTKTMVDEAETLLAAHFGDSNAGGGDIFNRAGWTYIVEKLDGRIPIRICAVAEGTVVPVGNVLFTVESTDESVPWVVNYFETLLVQVWYPMTVCTGSYMQKRLIREYLVRTAGEAEAEAELEFKLHDFGFRGCTGLEAAGLGGAAHLVNFKGTDTLAALRFTRKYYGPKDIVSGSSIPATEHSTMTVWGKDRELEAVQHMLKAFPQGILSVVSDSYDLWNFLDNIVCLKLKDEIIHRKGTLVIRPDSGNPVEVVLKVLKTLGNTFGTTANGKGFKVLPSFIRIIQGDGICYETIGEVLAAMEKEGWSSINLTFGSGGALLQKLDRDTQRCAYKCCLAIVDGKKVDVYKDPVTDPGKLSKRGDLVLIKKDGVFKTIRKEELEEGQVNQLIPVFENGKMLKEYSFEEVRSNSRKVAR